MTYETSYDTGLKPFNHDKKRGKWSSPMDFFFACLGHSFKVDAIFVMPSVIIRELGIYGFIPYFIALGTCSIPLVFIQSFLGQFSSTGFISVFRIAPLFKGIGYVSLAINLTTLTYFSVFGAIPLFYFFHSLRPTLPWSCEGAKEWMILKKNVTSPCVENMTVDKYTIMDVPSLEFFRVHLKTMDLHQRHHPEGTFSWSLMICTFLIWVMVVAVLSKPIEVIARFVRFSCLAIIGILSLCIIRCAFLPDAIVGLRELVAPSSEVSSAESITMIPLMAMSVLGPGWGSVLTMASYNNFKTNIFRFSWLLCFAQFGIMFGIALLSMLVTSFLQRHNPEDIYFLFLHTQWMEFLITPTALTFLELPHFWTLIFFSMMILGCLNLLIVQLFSVLTSLFDEYENLRTMKKEVTLVSVVILALTSIYFCSNYGITFSEILIYYSIVTQMILNLLLLLVVLWVYGRERFQRDLNFMTSRTYSTWMVNVVRYVTPIFLLISLLIGLVLLTLGNLTWLMVSFATAIILLPWFLIPGYCIFKMMQTSGMLRLRFRRCVRPTDWYPVDPLDRQRYDDAFSNSEISHQLTTAAVE